MFQRRSCHGLPISHHRGSVAMQVHCMWNFYWTNWHRHRFFYTYFGIHMSIIILPVPCVHSTINRERVNEPATARNSTQTVSPHHKENLHYVKTEPYEFLPSVANTQNSYQSTNQAYFKVSLLATDMVVRQNEGQQLVLPKISVREYLLIQIVKEKI